MIDPEIWQLIFHQLSVVDLVKIRLVCKLFYQLTKNDYFLNNYKYSKVIQCIEKWKPTSSIVGGDGQTSLLSWTNSKSMCMLGLCLKYNHLDLFNEILTKAKKKPIVVKYKERGWGKNLVKTIKFRVNWVELYKKCGEGGHINCLHFLRKKMRTEPRKAHLAECFIGSAKNGHIDFMDYLQTNYTIEINRYEIDSCITKAIMDNNTSLVKYLHKFSSNVYQLTSISHPRNILREVIKNKNKELLNLLFVDLEEIYQIILRSKSDVITWAIEENVINLDDKLVLRVCKFMKPRELHKLVNNGFVDKKCIDWDDYFMKVIFNRPNWFPTESEIKFMQELVSSEFNYDIFISEFSCNKSVKEIDTIIKILQNKHKFNWKKIIIYLLNNAYTSLIKTEKVSYFYSKREEEIENQKTE